MFKENKLKTILINHGDDPENKKNANVVDFQDAAQIDLDELGLDGGRLRDEAQIRAHKFTSLYSNLTFSNFKSFMPLPRKEDLSKSLKIRKE